MAPLIISSPTAAAAYTLVDLLHEHCNAVATPQMDSSWQVCVELTGAPRDVLPATLSAAREWLDRCGLASAPVAFDGQTYLLRGSARPGWRTSEFPSKAARGL